MCALQQHPVLRVESFIRDVIFPWSMFLISGTLTRALSRVKTSLPTETRNPRGPLARLTREQQRRKSLSRVCLTPARLRFRLGSRSELNTVVGRYGL
jgi:hypothetical protein